MKKSFMTRVLAVTLSTAMAFSVSSANNLMTASAATKPFVALKTKFKTLSIGQKYKMTLKNNSIKWRIQSATSSDKTIVKPYVVKPTYVKLKGLAEGRVKVTYKLKTNQRKTNNTKTLRGTVQVKENGGNVDPTPDTTTFSATASAADTTNVKITFSQAIDTEGVTAENFAVNKDVTVREAKVSEDGKTVDLTVAGATYGTEYEVTVTGVKVAGEAKDAITCKFTTPELAAGFHSSLTIPKNIMKSDGQSTQVLKFELRDSAGELIADQGVEVEFTTTLGNFAEPRAVLDKGVAENTFTSQALSSTRTATITATVIAANNKDLIGQSAMGNITLTPNPDDLTDTSIGAIITNAVAPTADRVIAYFQKEVDAADFRKSNGALDESKFTATVKSGVDSAYQGGTQEKVVGVLPVEGEPNALQLLVENPLIDNTTVSVTFQDRRNKNSVITSSNTVYCKLTDGYQPSALKVNVVDNRTLEIEFSEAVLRSDDTPIITPTTVSNRIYAADRVENYAIDTTPLSAYGVDTRDNADLNEDDAESSVISSKDTTPNQVTTRGYVSVGRYRNAVDNRHIVTIKLGEGNSLRAGHHSIAISNVGDWAALTDGWRNIINTATVDFEVPADDKRPGFELQVMSPEQYKLTANCDFGIVDANTTFRVADSSVDPDKCIVELQQRINGQWTTISNSGSPTDGLAGTNPIMVSQIRDEDGNLTREFLVETMKDWTVVNNTKSTANNYHQNTYRLRIASGKIRNLSNTLTNEEITIPLSDDPIMTTWDGTSPTISSIAQATDANGNLTSNYDVTFSEPVKMNSVANKEGMTPTQDTQSATATSQYSAYFVKKDSSQKQVQAEVGKDNFINAEDTMIRVKPVSALDGGEWELYVRGAFDDVGNGVPTLSGTITVNVEQVATNFKVVWAAVSKTDNYSGITSGEGGYIFVKFNKPISYYGGSANVGSTLNYALNGNPLPAGSNIRAHINGYDEHSSRIDSITIDLPKNQNGGLGSSTMNYLVNGETSILTISSAITSLEGDTLAAEIGYDLPYHFGEYNVPNLDGSIYNTNRLTAEGDAVWGNAPSEQWDRITQSVQGTANKHKAYVDAVKAALKNDKYRTVRLDSDLDVQYVDASGNVQQGINADLSADRIVNLDLNGCNVVGNIDINTQEAAKVLYVSNSLAGTRPVTVTGKSSNKAGDATLTINTPNAGVELGQGIEFVKAVGADADADVIKVNGVTSDTLTIYSEVAGSIRLTGSGMGIRNESSKIGKIIVDTTGTVNLKGTYTAGSGDQISIVKAANLVITDANMSNAVTITAEANAAKITVRDDVQSANNITVVAKADKVEIRQNTATGQDVTLKQDGGTFVQKNADGTDKPASEQQEPDSIGVQGWLDELHVIDDSECATGVEYVTVSAVTAGALLNNDKSIEENLKNADRTIDGATWKVDSVTASVNAQYLTYDSKTKTVRVNESAGDIRAKVTNEFKVSIKVTNKATNASRTITKTIKVCIEPKPQQ